MLLCAATVLAVACLFSHVVLVLFVSFQTGPSAKEVLINQNHLATILRSKMNTFIFMKYMTVKCINWLNDFRVSSLGLLTAHTGRGKVEEAETIFKGVLAICREDRAVGNWSVSASLILLSNKSCYLWG